MPKITTLLAIFEQTLSKTSLRQMALIITAMLRSSGRVTMLGPTFRTLRCEEITFFDGRAKQPQDVSMNRFKIEHTACHHVPVLANQEHVDALKYLKDPAHCGRLRCFAHLIGD